MAETKGILLVAFGSKGYAYFAHNLAYSIKHNNSSVRVHLLHDGCIKYLQSDRLDCFDTTSLIEADDLYTDGRLDPGKLKTRLYDYLPYDNTLYLDVDAVALTDLSPVLDAMASDGRYYITSVQGKGKQDEVIPYSYWASNADIIKFFGLKAEDEIVAIQSSWAFMKKTGGKKFFTDVKKYYDKGFPKDKLQVTWGGLMPDELIYSGCISKHGIDASGFDELMYFGHKSNAIPTSEVKSNYKILSLYGQATGGHRMTSLKYWEFYDITMRKYSRTPGQIRNREHIYKGGILAKYKHANSLK
jgi:hypothetical protein